MPNLDLDRSMDEVKKYELLVPKKVLKKAQAKYKAKAKDISNNNDNNHHEEKLVLSTLPESQST